MIGLGYITRLVVTSGFAVAMLSSHFTNNALLLTESQLTLKFVCDVSAVPFSRNAVQENVFITHLI